jgi:hypothetical protein
MKQLLFGGTEADSSMPMPLAHHEGGAYINTGPLTDSELAELANPTYKRFARTSGEAFKDSSYASPFLKFERTLDWFDSLSMWWLVAAGAVGGAVWAVVVLWLQR